MLSTSTDPSTAIAHALLQRHSFSVSPAWLALFLSSARTPLPPIPALTSTAHFRLLASDFTQSLSTTASASLFPSDISSPAIKERTLLAPIPVQLLDLADIASSAWSQLEILERIERGEQVRGREVIRTLPAPESESASASTGGSGAHHNNSSNSQRGPLRLILQDARGTKVVAFEKVHLAGLVMGGAGGGLGGGGGGGDANAEPSTSIGIGMKLLLKEATSIRRGVVMLTPDNVVVLGGRVDAWDKAWRQGRKDRLLKSLESDVAGTLANGNWT